MAWILDAPLAEWFGPSDCVGSLVAARALCLDAREPFASVVCNLVLLDGAGAGPKNWLDIHPPP